MKSKASFFAIVLVALAAAAVPAAGGARTAAAAGFDGEVLADSPRGYWRLGETSGTVAADSSGNGNPGSYKSGVTLGVPGALGGDANTAARFDGADDRVTMLDPASGIFDFGTSDFTAEAWIKTTLNGERTVIGKRSSGPYWQVTITDDAGHVGQVRAQINAGANRTGYSTARVDDGAWHHVVVAFQRASGIAFYVDGAAAGFAAGAATGSVDNAAALQLGKTGSVTHFGGDIDEAAVYDVALAPGRILAHYLEGSADTIAPTVSLAQPANGEETLDTTPTFAGTAGTAPGDSSTVVVKVYAGAAATGTPVQTRAATAAGNGAYAVDADPALGYGEYTARAEQSDADGNVGLSPPRTFTVSATDTVAPVVALTMPANGSTTADPTPTFAGTAGTAAGDSSGVTVKIYIGPSATGTPVQTLTASAAGNGAYAVDAVADLPLGEYTARSEQSDAAANVGFSAPATFTVAAPYLVAAGDITACGESTQDEPTAALLDSMPDAVIALLGDNAYSAGSATEYANCYQPTWGRHKARTRPSPGNHDYTTTGAAGYYGYFGAAAGNPSQGWYSYDVGDWHVVSLNSNCYYVGGCHEGSAQEQWLRADLAAHAVSCTLAYWHHPRFNSSGTDTNNLEVEPLWDALYDHGAEIILNGHAHLYERYAPQTPAGALDTAYGIRQFIVGTGGYALYPWGTIQQNSQVRFNDAWGVLKLTLQPNGYTWQFVPIAGQTRTDSGSGACHGVPPGPPPPPADTTPPVISLAAPANGSSTSDSTPTFAGTAGTVAGDSTTVTVNVYAGSAASGIPVQTLVTSRSGGGSYSVDATSPLALGTYTAQAEQGDAGGNTGRSSANTFMVVEPAPPPPPPPPPPPGTGPAVRATSSATANGPASQLTIAKPVGTAAGDLLLAVVAHQGGSAKNMTAPAGWTEVPGTNVYQGTNARIHAWYRFAGAAEPDFFLFALTGGGDDMAGGIMAIAGARAPSPVDAAAGQANGTSTRSVTAPSVTTTVADTLLVFGGACSSPVTFAPPAGMTEQWDVATGGTYRVALETAVQSLGGAQATGTRVATASTSCRSVGIDVAIAPAQ